MKMKKNTLIKELQASRMSWRAERTEISKIRIEIAVAYSHEFPTHSYRNIKDLYRNRCRIRYTTAFINRKGTRMLYRHITHYLAKERGMWNTASVHLNTTSILKSLQQTVQNTKSLSDIVMSSPPTRYYMLILANMHAF